MFNYFRGSYEELLVIVCGARVVRVRLCYLFFCVSSFSGFLFFFGGGEGWLGRGRVSFKGYLGRLVFFWVFFLLVMCFGKERRAL